MVANRRHAGKVTWISVVIVALAGEQRVALSAPFIRGRQEIEGVDGKPCTRPLPMAQQRPKKFGRCRHRENNAASSTAGWAGIACSASFLSTWQGAFCLLESDRERASMTFEQSPTLPIGFAPRDRFDLAPVSARARTIGCIASLAHHAFQPMLFGRREEFLAVIEGVHQVQTGHLGPREQPLEESALD